jgi:ABC-type antimicrobial peptide transport system permease subunit
MAQDSYPRMTLIANAQNTNGPLLSALRSRIESVPGGASVPVVIKTLAEHLSQTAMAPLRIVTVMISASATVALLLTVLGLFSALSDSVGHRRREFAIRVALGAQRWHVIYQVLLDGGRLACVGVLAGTVASFLLSRLVAGIAPAGASPNLWTYLAAPLALAVAVIVASVLPARGASLVNPVTIMRN